MLLVLYVKSPHTGKPFVAQAAWCDCYTMDMTLGKRIKWLLAGSGALLLCAGMALAYVYSRPITPAAKSAAQQSSKPTPQPAQPAFDKVRYSLADATSLWVIVNKQHPLAPLSFAPGDLVSVGNGQQMRAEAASALQQMFADAKAAGLTLDADSGYRSYATQVSTYGGFVKQYGQTYTDTISARPGYSEHQTGWAVDIGTDGCHVDNCFANTPAGQWAAANAYKYGFLLRYPGALTPITGYSHEAWHFRYVGVELTNELHRTNTATLEQFFGIRGGPTYAP